MHAADSPCCDGNSTWASSTLDRELSRFQIVQMQAGGEGHYHLLLPQVGGLLLKNYGKFL
jgi:hypothetical protein